MRPAFGMIGATISAAIDGNKGSEIVPLKKSGGILPPDKATGLVGKITRGKIALPLVRMDAGQKAARGIHVTDLANWIDTRRAAAVKELRQMTE